MERLPLNKDKRASLGSAGISLALFRVRNYLVHEASWGVALLAGSSCVFEGFQIKNLMKGISQYFWDLMELESIIMMSQLEWKACP